MNNYFLFFDYSEIFPNFALQTIYKLQQWQDP